jgi:hypothetical protein
MGLRFRSSLIRIFQSLSAVRNRSYYLRDESSGRDGYLFVGMGLGKGLHQNSCQHSVGDSHQFETMRRPFSPLFQ